MELLTYTVPTVRFNYPDQSTTAVSATYSINGGDATNISVTSGAGYATAQLPYQSADAQIQVTWNFTIPGSGTYSRTTYYDVVTPLLDESDVRAIIGGTATDDEVQAAEASARYIIQSYTGQTFGKYVGALSVTGSGENFLRLPRRLISLTSINDDTTILSWVTVRGDGWFIQSLWPVYAPSIRADWDGWHQIPNTGVITAPPKWLRPMIGFISNVDFTIDGTWGWDTIPGRVVEAAKLLVNDYACGDSIYRDRYISAITGPDWQMEFSNGAYTSTGNVRADQLLGDYKLRRGWSVI